MYGLIGMMWISKTCPIVESPVINKPLDVGLSTSRSRSVALMLLLQCSDSNSFSQFTSSSWFRINLNSNNHSELSYAILKLECFIETVEYNLFVVFMREFIVRSKFDDRQGIAYEKSIYSIPFEE